MCLGHPAMMGSLTFNSNCIFSFLFKYYYCRLALATQFIWLPRFSNWSSSTLSWKSTYISISFSSNTLLYWNHHHFPSLTWSLTIDDHFHLWHDFNLHFSAFCWRSASSSIFSSRSRREFWNSLLAFITIHLSSLSSFTSRPAINMILILLKRLHLGFDTFRSANSASPSIRTLTSSADLNWQNWGF